MPFQTSTNFVSKHGQDARDTFRLLRRRGSGSARRAFGGFAAAVASENSRRGKLAELVADHVFLHEHAVELVAVVNFKRMPDKFGDDGAGAGPGLQGRFGAILI